ncbi:MAG: iron-sulfur cluster carrier protein [marine bacterium B5-7]|nr:MAG: iron-sulfur cluster carrier protein [marine bacterium B5-7]
MSDLNQAAVESSLKGITDPHTGRDIVTSKLVREIEVKDDTVKIKLVFTYPAKGWHDALKAEIVTAVGAIDRSAKVNVDISTEVTSHSAQKGVQPIANVKNIIAVASGKGGVGKSTVSVNLALALSAEGATVGILDADIYGPSQPRMLGVSSKPESSDGKSLEPLTSYHLQAMSIGFLIDEETPMIWRGPMVTQALEQLLKDTRWRDVDYLIIDLPPGTGDTQLTLAQKVPVSGAVIVTTPQDIALLDARKAVKMFEKVEIPILGVVENMSTHICSNCGHEEHIFGEGGGQKMASDYDIEFLGDIPLDRSIREDTDGGRPTVVADPDGRLAMNYREIARNIAGRLSSRKRDYSDKFPSIVIQNN